MADLESSIVVKADVSGVESGMQRARRTVNDFANTAAQAGRRADEGLSSIGQGGESSARKVEAATRSMQGSIQRQIAAMQAGSKESSAYWEALASQRGVNVNVLRPLLDQLDAARAKTQEATAATVNWRNEITKVGPLLATVVSAVSFTSFVAKLVSVQREIDVLNASLVTVTGSSAAAERELAWLKDFAAATPFGLSQATEGFIKMKSLGLDPTRAALTSFGNTAAAMGKSLNQMIEAVADASTSEFERLKEFGIKAKQEGTQVSLTFQGVTTNIGNNAREITQYLENIGNSTFGGAMELRAKTLDGAISELGDTWDELFRRINDNSAGSVIYDSVILASGAVQDLTSIIGALTTATDANTASTGAMKTVQEGIAVVFETVAVVGVTVASTLTGVGREIGALAAQVVALGTLDISGFKAIGQAVKEDAVAARKEWEATVDRILNARNAASSRPVAEEPTRTPTPRSAAGPSADDKKAENAYKSLIESIREKIALQEAELASGEKLTEADKLRVKIMQELSGARRTNALRLVEELAAGERLGKTRAAEAKDTADAAKAYADLIDARQSSLANIQTQIQREKDVAAAIGLTKRQVTELEIAKLEESAASKERRADYLDEIDLSGQAGKLYREEAKALRDLAIAKRGTADKQSIEDLAKASAEAAKRASEEWERAAESINQSLTDALLRGFEDGKGLAENFRDTLKNMVFTLAIRPVVSSFTLPLAQALSPTAGAIGGASSALGGIGSLGNIASLFGGAGSAASYGLSALLSGNGLGALSGGFGMLTSGGTMAAMTQGLGMITGVVGPIALGVAALTSLLGSMKGEKRFGGQYGYDATQDLVYNARRDNYVMGQAGQVTFLEGPSGGEVGRAEVTKAIDSTVTGINAVLKGLGSQLSIASFQAGLETSEKGRGGVFAGGSFGNGITFGESGRGDPYAGTLFESTSSQSLSAEEAIKAFSLDLLQATVQALQAATDLPKTIADSLRGIDAEALTDDAATQLLTTINAQIEAVNGFRMVIDQIPIINLRNLAFDSVAAIVEAFGGIDAASQNVSGYFQNFYSETERTAILTDNVSRAMAALGLEMPSLEQSSEAARAEFRALVESIDATTAEGAKQVAGLLSLEGAFAQLTPAVESTAAAVKRSAQDIASERESLQRQILQLQGDTAGLRALDLAKLDESNRPLLQQVFALQDAAAAATAAAQAQAAMANAAASAAQQVRSSWKSIGDSLIDEVKRIRGEMAGTGSIGFTAAQAQFATATAQARAGDQNAANSLPELSRTVLELAEQNARSALELKVFQSQIAASLTETIKYAGQRGGFSVPKFAAGGNHMGGLALVGEMGPELALLPPARIYTANQTAGLLDQSALLAEIRALKEQLRTLVEQGKDGGRNVERTAQTIEDWSRRGVPVRNQPSTTLVTA